MSNLLIVITALFLIWFFNITSSAMPGGDRGVGYALVQLLSGGGFILFSGLLAWSLASANCFDWLPVQSGQRGQVVFLGWIVFVVATMASALFRGEWHPGEMPEYLHWFAKAWTALWMPLLVFVSAFALANVERSAGTAPSWVQMAMKTAFSVSALICLGIFYAYLRIKFTKS